MFPLLLLIVTVLLVHFESRTTFPNRDTLIYSIVADRWSSGAIPYRDIVDHKPPGIYALYRTFFFVGERSPRSIWQGMTWVAGLASLSVYLGFRTHKRFAAGIATGVGLFALMSADTLGLGAHAQNNTESLAVAWAAVAFGLMLGYQRSRSIWWVVGAGAAFAAAVLSKQPAGWWLLPLALQIVVAHRGRRWRKQLGGCVMGTMGFAIGAGFGLGVCLAYFAFYDSLYAFYDWVYLRNLVYAKISWRQVHFHWSVMGLAFHTLLDKLMTPRAVPITVGMLFLAWMLLSRRSWLAAVTLLWCITSLAASSMGIAVHDHYLVFTQLALAMVVGVMFDWMYGRSALQWRAPGVAILSATILSALLFRYDINGVDRRLNGGKSTPKYTQEVIRLAQIVREHAAPDDRMYAFGDPFDLLFYAEMKPAGRYIYYPGAQLRTNPNDYMEEVERSIPRFIYIGADTYGPFMAEDKSIRGMLKRYLDEHYELWLDGGFGRVYQRRQPDNLRKSKRPGRSIPASETS